MSPELITTDIIKAVRQDNCFDFLRYLFAVSLIIAHFCTLTDTDDFGFLLGGMRVKAFFTITGFLVTYSYLRIGGDLCTYVKRRFARIVPAYMTAITFCLVLGMCVTDDSIASFLSNAQTWKYYASNLLMLNWIEPELPNTFQDNLHPQMDGSLWSMKFEVLFYCLVPALIMIFRRIGKVYSLGILAVIVLSYSSMNIHCAYFSYFISGMTLLLFFDKVSKHILLLFIASALIMIFGYYDFIPAISPICGSLEPVAFPIILIAVAYNCKVLNIFRKFENITYGLFLYHFPIIQLTIKYGLVEFDKTAAIIVVLISTALLAITSCKLVEQPLMKKYH